MLNPSDGRQSHKELRYIKETIGGKEESA